MSHKIHPQGHKYDKCDNGKQTGNQITRSLIEAFGGLNWFRLGTVLVSHWYICVSKMPS